MLTKVLGAGFKYTGEELVKGEDNGTRRGFASESFPPRLPYTMRLILT